MSVTLSLFALDLPAAEIAALGLLLSPVEQARARRYRFERDTARFIARHGQLRLLLGQILHVAPDRLSIDRDAFDRPFLAGGPAFSLALSDTIGLCAIADRGPIGCDIERHDAGLADRAIAARLFTPGERRALAALPVDRWTRGFFDCWTRKEAVVKALGVGCSYPLDRVEAPAADALSAPFAGLRVHAFDSLLGYSLAVCAAAEQGVDPPRWFACARGRQPG